MIKAREMFMLKIKNLNNLKLLKNLFAAIFFVQTIPETNTSISSLSGFVIRTWGLHFEASSALRNFNFKPKLKL